jgi:hypothetical protein
MAKTDSTAVVQTVACDLGNCGSCRGQVVTLTLGLDAPIVPCAHICHLPDAWREQVVLTPPCDSDAVLDHDEIERLADLDGDRLLENEYVGVWSL